MNALKRPNEFHGVGGPSRISDDLLFAASAERQNLQHRAVAIDEATEDEATGGTGQKDVAVEQRRKIIGIDALAPDRVAGAIFADGGVNLDGDHAGRRNGGRGEGLAARRLDAVVVKDRRNWQVGMIGQLDKIPCRYVERSGNAVQPANRYGACAGFEATDGLGRRWRRTFFGDVKERQPLGTADFADTSDQDFPLL
jgi:hypothetical protein